MPKEVKVIATSQIGKLTLSIGVDGNETEDEIYEDANEILDQLDSGDFNLEIVKEKVEIVDPIKVIAVKIISIEKHPNADRLTTCVVYDGSGWMLVICGATNIAVNDKVAFAPVGCELPNGMIIKKAKIRGVESFGMLCSREELGMPEIDGVDGIF